MMVLHRTRLVATVLLIAGSLKAAVGQRTPRPTPAPTSAPTTPAPTVSYPASMGCYMDKKDDRVLTNMLTSASMTPLVCAAHCSGYPYFGTQYGTECWCGKAGTDFDKHGKSSSCTTACSGDGSATCGGYYAFQLYDNPTPKPTPAPTPAPTMYGALGCFKDSKNNRVLTNMLKSAGMTYEKCAAHCSDYFYFGVQYGEECWCGAAGTDYDKYGPSTCDYACTGDPSAPCGGYLAFDLFVVPQPAPTPAPTPGPTLYPKSLGCYKDVRESRVFVNMLSSDKMTPLVCAAHCSAYTFYATQYGEECWCGSSDVDYAVHGTSTCDMPCTGDASATCGGFYAFNVYNIPKAPTPAPTTPAPTVARLGCFKDRREDRVLEFQTSSSTMTPDVCYAACASASTPFRYYAVQYGLECWCGEAGTVYDIHGMGVCDSPCRGDSSLTCGGTFAFEIYPFPASAAPTPAPTTLAPTHAPTPLTGGAAIALARMSYQDLLTAARDGGEFNLVVRDAVTNEIVGSVIVTVTMARRRQMMEAVDGQQGLRGDSRDLQTSSTFELAFAGIEGMSQFGYYWIGVDVNSVFVGNTPTTPAVAFPVWSPPYVISVTCSSTQCLVEVRAFFTPYAAPTPAPTAAITSPPTLPQGVNTTVAAVTMGYDDLENAAQDQGEISLQVVEQDTNQPAGNVIATVTPADRRQLMEALDGQQWLRGDGRDLQGLRAFYINFSRITGVSGFGFYWLNVLVNSVFVGNTPVTAPTLLPVWTPAFGILIICPTPFCVILIECIFNPYVPPLPTPAPTTPMPTVGPTAM